uniref:Uncharacterized protein n=1 Tax=Anguilla anguilla TaxID=7936 RepID=A0A0E9SZL2_ANGAN
MDSSLTKNNDNTQMNTVSHAENTRVLFSPWLLTPYTDIKINVH